MPLRLGGITYMTSIDFPGRLAAVLYCQGCPWRCTYCHNPQLLSAKEEPKLSWDDALTFLRSRKGLLDGVVFSGGEPMAQGALEAGIDEVREMGFQVAVHTGGMFPERLEQLLPKLDWVGLDVKALPTRYQDITHAPNSGERAFASVKALVASGVEFECRTTWHAGIFPVSELMELANALRDIGVRHWALQECRTKDAPAWMLDKNQIDGLAKKFEQFVLRRS
ncbi:MAG: anaerobic ribonucleoside-triphosphate reductase activating protein [Actinomycetaceae bacterium]|nr:anaerobic ribonucleoside-triphosphate reductase activating protein [Actinomycetaceae bacterium]